MEYSNQLVPVQTAPIVEVALAESLCPHGQQPLSVTVPPPRKPKKKHLWVDALNLLEKTQALSLDQQAVQWARRNQLVQLVGSRRSGSNLGHFVSQPRFFEMIHNKRYSAPVGRSVHQDVRSQFLVSRNKSRNMIGLELRRLMDYRLTADYIVRPCS